MSEAAEQPGLFEAPPAWREHWGEEMPEFEQRYARPHSSIRVYFATEEDRRKFFEAVETPNPERSRGIWYPYRPRRRYADEAVQVPQGRYPVYVISKGRADTRLTSKALERLGIDYRIVVEPQEVEAYAEHIAREKILTLPFSNLGQGSIPARNWCWEHAEASGAERHWILDDNIRNFATLNRNENRILLDANPFIPCETFVDRYSNVALAGLQYRGFASDKRERPPFRLNTRIYSCILISHALPFRWRGRYNEDTDLSLRALKAGWCTVLFNAYLIDKAATMTMAGGNTDELYAGDGRLAMAEELRAAHPDVVTITQKWGRPQHHVDYSPYRFNRLVPVGAEEESDDGGRSVGVDSGRVDVACGDGEGGASVAALDAARGARDRAGEGPDARGGGDGAEGVSRDAVAVPDGSSDAADTAALDGQIGLF